MAAKCNRCGAREGAAGGEFFELEFEHGPTRLYCRGCYYKLVARIDQEQGAGRLSSLEIIPKN